MDSSFIRIKTSIPGPNSESILERMPRAIPQALSVHAPVVIDTAHDSLIEDVDGNVFIDLSGGIGVLNVGHTHDRVRDALHRQVDRFLHTDFTVIPYEEYISLAERLNKLFPGSKPALTAFFNSGAEAVENAIKIARAYTKRPAIVTFERAFHGRTWMALSLTSKVNPYKVGIGPFVPEIYRVPFPYSYRCPNGEDQAHHECTEKCFQRIEEAFLLQVAAQDVAAVIVEPVQGEGGFVVPPPAFLPWLREFTRQHGILLIADEIQTGFGRTGTFFASEQLGCDPDLITVAKSIADGVPLSGVIGREEVMNAPIDSQIGGTYVGNPLACAAAHAVLDVFEQEDLLKRGRDMGTFLRHGLDAIAQKYTVIGEVRGLGAMLAIELVDNRQSKVPNPDLATRVVQQAMKRGLILIKAGVWGNVIRFLAPLTTPRAVIDEALSVLDASFSAAMRKT